MNLRLSVALRPGEDDEVIAERGARVFLELEAALLDDKVLDASVEQNQVISRSRIRLRSSRRICAALVGDLFGLYIGAYSFEEGLGLASPTREDRVGSKTRSCAPGGFMRLLGTR
jgi:hypothetical protein